MSIRPDKVMEQLILRDLKTVLQCKQFGKLCHESLQDVEYLNKGLTDKNEQINERQSEQDEIIAGIAEAEKHLSEVDVDLIRMRQYSKRLEKYTNRQLKHIDAECFVTTRELMMNKKLKLKLLNRCTGLFFDETMSADSWEHLHRLTGIQIAGDAGDLVPFSIENSAPEQVEHDLWLGITDSCANVSEMQKLFAESSIIGKNA